MPARIRKKTTHRKTISREGLKGQLGINAIERIIASMGSRWSPSGPNEVGIDGYIELFDPESREALGLTIAVQSRVMTASTASNEAAFDYWCGPAELEYWLNGNTPIILVLSDGTSNNVYWVSIKEYFKDWKPADSGRVTFVKAKDRLTRDSFPALATIAKPKFGLYLAPAVRHEDLHSNLLRLEGYPPHIYVAETECRKPHEVWSCLRDAGAEPLNEWILWEKKIFSFFDLGDAPWTSVCDKGTLEEFDSRDWSKSTEVQHQRIFVQLLNRTLKAQIGDEVRFWPDEECYAMAGPPRKMSYVSLKRQSKVAVVARFKWTATNGREFERFRHAAFRGQFRILDGIWYLEITPTYRFTSDGYTLDRFHEDWLKGIKRIEGNRAVLSSVLFWAYYLRPRAGLFPTSPLLRFGDLVALPCSVGIADEAWLAGDPGSAKEPEPETGRLGFEEMDEV